MLWLAVFVVVAACKVVVFGYSGYYGLFEDYVAAVFGSRVAKCFWNDDRPDNETLHKECPSYTENDDAVFIGTPQRALKRIVTTAHSKKLLYLLVTEQASRHAVLDDLAARCKLYPNMSLVHYSTANIDLLAAANVCHGHHHTFLPFLPCDNWLPVSSKAEKKYDVSFVGGLSERRSRLLKSLEESYKVWILPSAFGEQRQKMLAESKILINIHFSDDYRVLETMRCTEAALAGVLVLSEAGAHENLTVIEELFFFSPYARLAASVEFILTNYEWLQSRQLADLEYIHNNSLPRCVTKIT